MSQFDFPVIDPLVTTGTELADYLNSWVPALESNHTGATRPSYLPAGGIWTQQVSPTDWRLMLYTGSTDAQIALVDPTTGVVSPAFTNLTLTGNLTAGNAVSDSHAFMGPVTMTAAVGVAGLSVIASGGDRLTITPQAAASGVALMVRNVGSTDYEPLDIRGESITLNYRTGVNTFAAGITLAATGAVTISNTLGITGALTAGSFSGPHNGTLGATTPDTATVTTLTVNTNANPDANDGAALGTGALSWSDLFLATGGVINWANGNVILTHAAGILTVSTGDLRVTTAGTNAASVVTVGGTQTLTGKTLTSPTIGTAPTAAGATWANLGTVTTADINGGTIDGTVIGGASAAAGTFTNLTATGIAAVGTTTSATTALNLAASTTGVSSLRLAHGAAPSAPVNGDVWTTTAGLFARINGTTISAGGGVIPAPIRNSLGADVALNNTAAFFDGPSVAQGSTGTWFVSGTVTVNDSAGAGQFIVKLWDGTNVIATAVSFVQSATRAEAITLSGYITSPVGNLRLSVKDASATTGRIVFNESGLTNDSNITAFRIA